MRAIGSVYAANSLFFENNRNRRTDRERGVTESPQASHIFAPKNSAVFIPQCEDEIKNIIVESPPPPDFMAIISGGWASLDSDASLIDRTRQFFGLTARDRVQIFVIPRGQGGRRGLQPGAFMHRPTTNRRTQQLNLLINRTGRQIREKELDSPRDYNYDEQTQIQKDEERAAARELQLLRLRLEEYRQQMRREQQRLANGPRRGFIVVERDE
ncbi:MAG: hypothetical protein FWB74_02045 [Defluviitaleaceae bacterium]|nr:hypothetical protein [Defluviitaleaceae bacterium]